MLFYHSYEYIKFMGRIWAYESLDVVGEIRGSHSMFHYERLGEEGVGERGSFVSCKTNL